MKREQECQNPVHERQLCSGDVGFVTWRSSSYIDLLDSQCNMNVSKLATRLHCNFNATNGFKHGFPTMRKIMHTFVG